MAIKITMSKTGEGKPLLTAEIDNGHLDALKKITDDYRIDGDDKTLGFLLAVVAKSEGKPIKVGEDVFVPGEAIKRKDLPPQDGAQKVVPAQ